MKHSKTIVQKYGGSSLASLDKIGKVAKKVADCHHAGNRVVVVVSAMGNTTDELMQMACSLTENPGKRELDMLLTAGERISMSLLCMALQEYDIKAISLTGSQSGIMTTSSHSNARIVEVRPFRIEDALDEGSVVVVAGYQGVSYKREVTTLGRGGSDTTAVALAAALDAERCEIYSDVDGVYTADPNQLPAKHIAQISYAEMQELAAAGAKVLNAQAVEFAKNAGIVLYCRATDEHGKTTVVRKGGYPKTTGQITGVATSKGLVRLQISKDHQAQALLKQLEEHQIPSRQFTALGHADRARISLLIPTADTPEFKHIAAELVEAYSHIEISPPLGAVSLIGESINDSKQNLLNAMDILSQNSFHWHSIDTTSYRITFLLDQDQLQAAAELLHRHFIEKTNCLPPQP